MNKIETALGLMYSMICGGESHTQKSVTIYNDAKEEIKELRAEVERLKKLIEDWKMIDCNQAAALTNVAVRCAEIAEQFHWTETEEGGGVVADAIRKEFNL